MPIIYGPFRWFSTNAEIDLSGHGTLAAAHILMEEGFSNDEVKALTFPPMAEV